MARLQTEPCEPECNEVTEFHFTFNIESFEMKKAEKFRDFEKELTFTWDGVVIKSIAKNSLDELIGMKKLIVYASPKEMFKKLRYSPIMLNFMAVCEDFGTLKLPMSSCFTEAVMCSDFKTQALQNEFKFLKEGVETATMVMSFMIEKISSDSASDALKSFEGASKTFQRNLKKKMNKKRSGDDSEDDEEQFDPCQDVACLDELPEHCKKSLELGEHVYKIINGHLINVRDRKGICGEICETTKKYCSEYRKSEPSKVSSPIDLQKLFPPRNLNQIECEEPSDDDRINSEHSLNFNKLLKSNDMKKYFEEQMLKVRQNSDEIGCGDGPKEKRKCKKKRKVKKGIESEFKERSKSMARMELTRRHSQTIEPVDPQRTFIKKMKRKSRGKYSYEFGNTYPHHNKPVCSIPSRSHCIETVPSKMGWRHDKLSLCSNKKWFPGHINKTVRLLMKCHLNPYPYDTLMLSNAAKRNRNECHEPYNEQDELQKETLHIKKRNGEISLTMRPLKERKQLETDCNPYLNCSPLKLVLKQHPEEMKKHQARVILKARGCMRKCNCSDIKLCRCMSCVQKKLLQHEMKRLSAELKMKEEMQFEDVYETSDNEIDFAFTPPSATDAKRKSKPDVAHTGTQYELKHFMFAKFKKKNQDSDDKGADDGKIPSKSSKKVVLAKEKLPKKTLAKKVLE